MYNKAWIALIMAFLTILEQWLGWTFGLSEDAVVGILALLTPVLVWLVPNRGMHIVVLEE